MNAAQPNNTTEHGIISLHKKAFVIAEGSISFICNSSFLYHSSINYQVLCKWSHYYVKVLRCRYQTYRIFTFETPRKHGRHMRDSASDLASYKCPKIYSVVFKVKFSISDAFRKITKSDSQLRHVCPSARPTVRLSAWNNWAPTDGFPRNLIFPCFSKNLWRKFKLH